MTRQPARARRDEILSQLYEKKEVASSNLAEALGVSEATIRRDLHALQEQGRVELVHGGAVLPARGDYSYWSKAVRNVEAKRLIGEMAVELVQDGDQIFIDSGTTCFEMAGRLKKCRGVSVIVNSARLALELDSPSIEVLLLGGHYRPDRMDTIGPLATAALDQLRGYVAFIGADGLSMDFGLTASDVESAYLYRLAVANARRCVLLVDHDKFTSPSLCRIVEWAQIDTVVTDQPPAEPWQGFLQERNINIITPAAETSGHAPKE